LLFGFQAVKTFTEAVLTVNPFEAVGKVTNLWIQFAEYYEAHDEIENVNDIFEKAVKAKYRHVEDLATIW
jgi:pre-mRNA-splicing factor SYF1